jgi:hypothetical protein
MFLGEVAYSDDLPFIEEKVDELIILSDGGNYARLIFIKDNKVLAHRLLLDDMIFTSEGKMFVVMWQDYSIVDRKVSATHFGTYYIPDYETNFSGPWWDMRRVMTDLKAP